MAEESKTIREDLYLLFLLSDRLVKSAQEAESSKSDFSDLARQATQLSQLLRDAARAASSTQSLYDRPLRRVSADLSKNLERALNVVRKCKHGNVLRHVFPITATGDFRKVSSLLESSIADLTWVLSILSDSGTDISLPPLATNDPILAWVWSSIAAVQMSKLRDRVEAANSLASLARDSDRNKKLILEESGVPPLLRLLKEGPTVEAQIAAATALYHLGTDREKVRVIASSLAVPTIVKVLNDSPIRVQIPVVNLVSRLAELDSGVREDLGRENVTRPLITLLSMDAVLDDPNSISGKHKTIHSIVQINKEIAKNSHPDVGFNWNSSSANQKGREFESPEEKLRLKVSCAKALWKTATSSVSNCRKITETKALLCLAKLIETEKGELQYDCLMTVMELVAVAESNADLRRAAFKPNSPAAKAVLDQLLRVVNYETNPTLVIPAVKSIGSLARTFPAKETRIISPLVAKIGHRNGDISTESIIALGKFVCPENFNCVEHSKAIVEYNGMSKLMTLLRGNDKGQLHEVKLLCYLALHVGNTKAFEQTRALHVIEGAARHLVAQYPETKDLFAKAVHHLSLYQAGTHVHRQAHV